MKIRLDEILILKQEGSIIYMNRKFKHIKKASVFSFSMSFRCKNPT